MDFLAVMISQSSYNWYKGQEFTYKFEKVDRKIAAAIRVQLIF